MKPQSGFDLAKGDQVPRPFVWTSIHTVNESSSGGKPYVGGSIRQNACPSGMKNNNIQVQLFLNSGPFLASQHHYNSILHIFLTSPPYILFFFFSRSRIPLETGGRTVVKKGEYRINMIQQK